jgi:formate dehydrogenase subunit gamma
MTGAYRAMRDGYVDESWAQHHHLRWYEAVIAGQRHERVLREGEVPVARDATLASRRRSTA